MQRLRTRLRAGASTFPSATFALNFLTGGLDSRVTFTRGSNATLVDSTGKITYAPANLLLQSQTFDSGSWIKLAATVAADSTVAPDGTSTAYTIEATVGGAGAPRVYQRPAITGTTTYTISSYFKASGTNFAFLSMRTSGANWTGAEFDLSTGTVTRNAITGNVAYVGATISNVGNGWYRCTVTVTPTDTIAAGVGFIFFGSSDGTSPFVGGFPTFTNTGTENVFIWGAQLEQVTYQTTAGTYNPTTASAYYGPRFDYDPVTLAPKGLLIEESRTNLFFQSQAFDLSPWTQGTNTVTANALASPDGTTNADLFTVTSTGTGAFSRQISVVVATTAYTVSTFFKKGTADFANITVFDGADGNRYWFNLSTGAVASTAVVGAGYNSVSARIENYNNGWYRCIVTFTNKSSTSFNLFASFTDADASLTATNGKTGYLYGAQLEAGAFATSYIPTVASQVTRSADVAVMTGTNFSSWYNQSEGSLVAEFTLLPRTLSGTTVIAYNGSSNGRWSYLSSASARMNDGTNTAVAGSIATPTAINKTASALSSAGMAISLNGAAPGTSAYVGTFGPEDELNIGQQSGAASINGHIRQIAYYNTRLSNATLQALTA